MRRKQEQKQQQKETKETAAGSACVVTKDGGIRKRRRWTKEWVAVKDLFGNEYKLKKWVGDPPVPSSVAGSANSKPPAPKKSKRGQRPIHRA